MHELAKYVPQLPLHRRICFTEDLFPQLTLHIYNIVHEVHKYEIRFSSFEFGFVVFDIQFHFDCQPEK